MGAIVVKHNWKKQPTVPVQINWDNPLALNLRHCAIPVGNTFFDYVSKRWYTPYAGSVDYGLFGGERFLGSSTTVGGHTINNVSIIDNVSDSISAIIGVLNTTNNTTRKRALRVFGSGSSVFVLDFSSGGDYAIIGGVQTPGPVWPTCSISPSHPSYYLRYLGFTRLTGDGNTWRGAMNGEGALLGAPISWSTGNFAYLPDGITLSCNYDGSFPLVGGISFLMLFKEFASQAKLQALTANPWQIFRQKKRRIWTVPAASTVLSGQQVDDYIRWSWM